MKRLCVFCGSRKGTLPAYEEAGRSLARALHGRGLELVYGGGSVGLMGVVADEMLARGGRVIGVIPRPLWNREVGHRGLSETHLVDSMHERKAKMAALSDGFIALPGGLGTLEEIFEVWTWAQLGMHRKPCGFLESGGYWQPLLEFLDHSVREGFVSSTIRSVALTSDDPERLLDLFASYVPPDVAPWLAPGQT